MGFGGCPVDDSLPMAVTRSGDRLAAPTPDRRPGRRCETNIRVTTLMERGPATALLEFPARPAWTWIVAPDLRRNTANGAVTKRLRFTSSLPFEVAVDAHHPCGSAHNQLLTHLRADRLAIRTHRGIRIVFVRQRKDRHEPSAMLLVAQEVSPLVSAQIHPTQKSARPIIGAEGSVLIFEQQWQINVIRMQSVGNHVPMADDQGQEILQDGLRGEAVPGNEIVPPNLRKVFARKNDFGTANQSSQEAIQLLQVHRTLISQAFECRAQAIAFFIRQRLWLHDASK